MSEGIKIAVNGAAGRMGQRVLTMVHADPELEVCAALEYENCPHLGRDAGEVAGLGPIGVLLQTDLDVHADVVIDFSSPAGVVKIAQVCGERRIGLVAAPTGLNDDQRAAVLTASQTAGVVMAPSMSIAVNLAMQLVRDASRALKQLEEGVDVEIVERHHRYKVDAPSGTALKFGQIVAEELGQTEHVHGRVGQVGQRPRNEIGYHALRTGDNVGEHTIVFGMLGETLEVVVRGHTRDSYVVGAIAAAKYIAAHGAGLYSMADVLGFE